MKLKVDKKLFILNDHQPIVKEFYDAHGDYTYERLIRDTVKDIKNVQRNHG